MWCGRDEPSAHCVYTSNKPKSNKLHQKVGRLRFRRGVLTQVAPRPVRVLDLTPLTPIEIADLQQTLAGRERPKPAADCKAVMDGRQKSLGGFIRPFSGSATIN